MNTKKLKLRCVELALANYDTSHSPRFSEDLVRDAQKIYDWVNGTIITGTHEAPQLPELPRDEPYMIG